MQERRREDGGISTRVRLGVILSIGVKTTSKGKTEGKKEETCQLKEWRGRRQDTYLNRLGSMKTSSGSRGEGENRQKIHPFGNRRGRHRDGESPLGKQIDCLN